MSNKTLNNRRQPRECRVLFVEDVMEILAVCQTKAYNIIRKLNAELVERGVLKDSLHGGRIPEKYFYERVFVEPPSSDHQQQRTSNKEEFTHDQEHPIPTRNRQDDRQNSQDSISEPQGRLRTPEAVPYRSDRSGQTQRSREFEMTTADKPKKKSQSEFWNRLTDNLDQNCVFYEGCETPKMKELEEIYENLCEKFDATLNPAQQKAFYHLSSMEFSMRAQSQEAGIAIGINIGRELQIFITNPVNALAQASKDYPSIAEMHGRDITALESYLLEQVENE